MIRKEGAGRGDALGSGREEKEKEKIVCAFLRKEADGDGLEGWGLAERAPLLMFPEGKREGLTFGAFPWASWKLRKKKKASLERGVPLAFKGGI